jgi:hypothetical protein
METFHNKCPVEAIAIHRGNCFGSQIVDQAQAVLALWANINVPVSMILQLQPGHRTQQRVPIPEAAGSRESLLSPARSLQLEQFAAHSRDLLAYGGGGRGCHRSAPPATRDASR